MRKFGFIPTEQKEVKRKKISLQSSFCTGGSWNTWNQSFTQTVFWILRKPPNPKLNLPLDTSALQQDPLWGKEGGWDNCSGLLLHKYHDGVGLSRSCPFPVHVPSWQWVAFPVRQHCHGIRTSSHNKWHCTAHTRMNTWKTQKHWLPF